MKKFDPYNHFGFLTNRVSRLMLLLAGPNMKANGQDFPVSCIGILADLWSKDGVTQKELGSSIIKTKSSITKMLEALEEDGMIIKKDDTNDKRKKLIFLTQKGKEFQFHVEERSANIEKKVLAKHTHEEIKIAKEVLKTFYVNIKERIKKEDLQ